MESIKDDIQLSSHAAQSREMSKIRVTSGGSVTINNHNVDLIERLGCKR
jgi:hypothetical protein